MAVQGSSTLLLAAFAVCLALFIQNSVTAIETRPGAAGKSSACNNTSNVFDAAIGPQPRIIGGRNALEGRYPYFVSLLNQVGQHSCGGILVAPDIVMSAAHCSNIKFAQVGRWSLNDELDGYEEFEVEMPLHPHPRYNAGLSFSHDAMLLKLNRQSTKQYIRINENNDLPSVASASVHNALTTMGLGYTQFGNSKSAPHVLQEASLSYVPNHICERSKDPNAKETYQGLISNDMLCASDDGEDACQGDSGGPLVIKRESPKDDVLIGIVSWGFGCAHQYFPGVFSRVSYFSDWVKTTICGISSNPPTEFNCGNAVALPTDEDSVPVTVVLQLDDHPTEVSWSIVRKETDTTLVNVVAGTYTVAQDKTLETVFLPPGSNNYFKIFDAYGDGLCCDTPGNYRVVLGREEDGEVLLSGGGDFGKERWHEFQVPTDFKDKENKPDVQEGQIPLTVAIQLDGFPQEIGWRVDRLGIEIEEVIRIPAGIYSTPGMVVVRTVILEEDELYYFGVYDMSKDGIQNGKVQLFLGTTDVYDHSKLIFESDGNFQAGIDHTFLANFGPAPTNPPLVPSQLYLTLELRMDLYPGEISVQLRMTDGDVAVGRQSEVPDSLIFFRPPGYYADRVSDTVVERIPIPQLDPRVNRHFSFIISDLSEDGLCCSWSGSIETGYTLFEGDQSYGRVIADSKFESVAREITTFNLTLEDSGSGATVVEESPEPSYEIKVTFSLDVYPDETGFYIEDSSKRRVVDVPPGTYKDQHSVVEEIVTLEAGLYTFTIVDSFGDGLNRADSFYQLAMVGEDEHRLPIITGNGAFASQESQVFLVEGESAQYPLFIRTPSGNDDKELSFDVVRLDIAETNAIVASRWENEDTGVNEYMLLVTEGSLYRIIFETNSLGLDGDILINLGSTNPSVYKGMEFVVSPDEMENTQRWQVKVLAGHLQTPSTSSTSILTLQMKLDRFPDEVEWMLLSDDGDDFTGLFPSRKLRKRTLLAYGPSTLYDQSMDGREVTEAITVPEYAGNHSFTLVVTDSGGDGTCCSYGEGGPVELFRGSPEENRLILSEPFRTVRLTKTFHLMGTSASATMSSESLSVIAVVAVTTMLLV